MDIRCNSKHIKEFKELYKKNLKLFILKGNSNIIITLDDSVDEPIIMVKTSEGALTEWTRGYINVQSFLCFGYVRLIQKCPFSSFKKCIGEKCQLYLIRNATGDCSMKWQAILEFDR